MRNDYPSLKPLVFPSPLLNQCFSSMVGAAEQTQEQLLTRSLALLLPGMSPPSLDISEPLKWCQL